jgi:hypothetical protein
MFADTLENPRDSPQLNAESQVTYNIQGEAYRNEPEIHRHITREKNYLDKSTDTRN